MLQLPPREKSTRASAKGKSAKALPHVRLGLLQRYIRFAVRPTVVGSPRPGENACVFVLHRKSVYDLALLQHILRSINSESSETSLSDLPNKTFYLMRPAGWRRRFVMRSFPPAMTHWQEHVLGNPSVPLHVVPVSIFWGRTAHRNRFFWRDLISERFGPTASLRRALVTLFNRRDVLIQFGEPLHWHELSNPANTVEWNLRHIGIRLRKSFKETRHAVVGPDLERLDSTVARVVEDVAAESPTELPKRRELRREVRKMATRMSYPVMMFVKGVLRWYFKHVYDGLELVDADRLNQVARTHTLIYAPNHRSQTDYLVLSYLLFQHGYAIPQIASGDNLDIPVVGPILRRCGAFFMRRSFRDDPTYHNVLASYLRLCVEQGNSIEFFVEGGRSRTGLMLAPRFGLLSMILASRAKGLPRPIAVVPVYIAYETIPDAKDYIDELSGRPKTPERLRDVILATKLLGSRFGRVSLHIAEPIKLDTFVRSDDVAVESERLGYAITHAINDCAILNSVNLVALILLTSPTRCMDEKSCIEKLSVMVEVLQAESSRNDVVLPEETAQSMIDRCVQLGFLQREEASGESLLASTPGTGLQLAWFRNNMLHIVAIPGLVASIILNRQTALSIREAMEITNFLLPFVCDQLNMPRNLRTIRRWITHLERLGFIDCNEDHRLRAADDGTSRQKLKQLADTTRPMLNRFYIVVTTLLQHESESLTVEKLAHKAWETSQLSGPYPRGRISTLRRPTVL